MSHKIIRILNGVASIASSDETFFDVPVSELDFEPKIGDEVQCFKNGEDVVVIKQPAGQKSQVVKGSITDPRDGKVYKTVEIGSQIWLAENLNYKTQDSLCYDNDEEKANKYGRLYKLSEAKNACPLGWHLPSKKDFEELISVAGGKSVAGKTLKSTSGWQDNEGQSGNGSDSLGFAALPTGAWVQEDNPDESGFFGIGEVTNIWSDTCFLELYHHSDCADIEPFDENYANDFYSVRCIKDQPLYKVVRILNGVVSVASNSGDVFNVSVEELNFEPKTGDEVQCFRNGKKVIVFKMEGLKSVSAAPTTQVKNTDDLNQPVRNAPVDNPFGEEAETKKSNAPWIIVVLIVLVCVVAAVVNSNKDSKVDKDQAYKTVKIGNQIWMASNLNVKTKGSWCYNNIESNCLKNGRLYSWDAAKTACPKGWHLPDNTEWETLFAAVGGKSIAGKVLKSQAGWNNGGNGMDAVGFSALPVGRRNCLGGFNFEGLVADFWSASERYSAYDNRRFAAYHIQLHYDNEYALLPYDNYNFGLSVRCLKD